MSEVATDLSAFKAAGLKVSLEREEFKAFRHQVEESLAVAKIVGEFTAAATVFNSTTKELAEHAPSLFPRDSTRESRGFGALTPETFNLTFSGMIDDAAEKAKEYGENEGMIRASALHAYEPLSAELRFPYKRKASSFWLEAVSTAVEKIVIAGWTDEELTDGRYDKDENKPFVALIDPAKPTQKVKAYYGADSPGWPSYDMWTGSRTEQERAARKADALRIDPLIEAAVIALSKTAE